MSLPRFLQRLFANEGAGPKLLGSIIPFGTANPEAPGTASAGTQDEAARADHVHPGYNAATQSASGLMSAADKTKLDGIASGAQVNPSAATSAPKAPGTAAVGTSVKYAREDHVHPAQTIPGNMKGATTSAAGTAGLAPAPPAGSQATKYLRADGTWQVPPDNNTTYNAATQSAQGLMSAADKTKLDGIAGGATSNAPATVAPKAPGTAAVGTSAKYAREDHVHPAQTIPGNMKGATTSAAGTAGLAPAPPAGSQATKYLRADGTWQVPPDNNTTYSAATQSAAGLMSAADKAKLDGLSKKEVELKSMLGDVDTNISSGDWTITGLKVGQPLFILYSREGVTNNEQYPFVCRAKSGCTGGGAVDLGNGEKLYYKLMPGVSLGENGVADVFITIPTATKVVLEHRGVYKYAKVYAYQ